MRILGQSIYQKGVEFKGDLANQDELVPSTRCIPLSSTIFPKLLKSDWVAPNATVIGDVEVGEGSSLWWGTVVRGDLSKVKIGKNTLLMD